MFFVITDAIRSVWIQRIMRLIKGKIFYCEKLREIVKLQFKEKIFVRNIFVKSRKVIFAVATHRLYHRAYLTFK